MLVLWIEDSHYPIEAHITKVKELQKKFNNLLSDLMKPIVVVIGLIVFLFIVWKVLMCCVSHYRKGVDSSIP